MVLATDLPPAQAAQASVVMAIYGAFQSLGEGEGAKQKTKKHGFFVFLFSMVDNGSFPIILLIMFFPGVVHVCPRFSMVFPCFL